MYAVSIPSITTIVLCLHWSPWLTCRHLEGNGGGGSPRLGVLFAPVNIVEQLGAVTLAGEPHCSKQLRVLEKHLDLQCLVTDAMYLVLHA